MGFNTTLLILNDGFHEIRRNADLFMDDLNAKIQYGDEGSIGAGPYANSAYVMKTAYADVPRLYLTHQNGIVEVGRYGRLAADIERGNVTWYRDWIQRNLKWAKQQVKDMEDLLRENP